MNLSNFKGIFFLALMTSLFFSSCGEDDSFNPNPDPDPEDTYHFTLDEDADHRNLYELDENLYKNHKLYTFDKEGLENPNSENLLFDQLPASLINHSLESVDEVKVISGGIQSAEVFSRVAMSYNDEYLLGTIHHDEKTYLAIGDPNTHIQISELNMENHADCTHSDEMEEEGSNDLPCSEGDADYPVNVLLVLSKEATFKYSSVLAFYKPIIESTMWVALNAYGDQGVSFTFNIIPSFIEENSENEIAPETIRDNAEIQIHRNNFQADLVGVLTTGGSGQAIEINNTNAKLSNPENAFFYANFMRGITTFTISHEIGHLLGFYHNRADTSPDPDADYCAYGYRTSCAKNDGSEMKVASLMSYRESGEYTRIPVFSNDKIIPDQVTLPDCQIGVSCDEINSANTMDRLQAAAACVSKFR
jgi:hypothetical protein